VVLTNDNIKKYFGASSALLGLGKDAKNMFDEYDQHDTVGSDTAASLIANFTGLIAQVMKVVPPIAAPKFLVQLALESVSLISSILSLYLPNAEANAISNKLELEELLAELDVQRKNILENFISDEISEERRASFIDYINEIKSESDLVDMKYQDLENSISGKANQKGLSDNFFAEQGVIVREVIERVKAKEVAIDEAREIYSNEEFEYYLSEFTGRYDIDADVYFDDEGELIGPKAQLCPIDVGILSVPPMLRL